MAADIADRLYETVRHAPAIAAGHHLPARRVRPWLSFTERYRPGLLIHGDSHPIRHILTGNKAKSGTGRAQIKGPTAQLVHLLLKTRSP